jgi:hypothetical protein
MSSFSKFESAQIVINLCMFSDKAGTEYNLCYFGDQN